MDKTVVQPRPAVMALAVAMELKLRENEHKGNWRTCRTGWLQQRLRDEVFELERAVLLDLDIIGEAADVANFAMMIADVCGELILEGRKPEG